MTAHFELNNAVGYILLLIVLALVLHQQGYDVATALLVVVAALGLAGQASHRAPAQDMR